MKLVLPFRAALAFAPADLARAGSGEPVLEIVTFHLNEGADADAFLSAAKGTEAMLRDRGALIHRFLTVDANGLWTDVIEWSTMAEAQAAAKAVMQHPDIAPFSAMIDGSTVNLRHAPILWRME